MPQSQQEEALLSRASAESGYLSDGIRTESGPINSALGISVSSLSYVLSGI
jgi:hypothetical protein